MARIYKNGDWEYFVPGRGWMNALEYYKEQQYKAETKPTQYSVPYIDENGQTGTEDFTVERWRELKLKWYNPDLRLYGEGRGTKKVAKEIYGIGSFYATKRQDVTNYIKRVYAGKIEKGMEIKY